jgi:protein-S-isoprenylcysteine O-methyltransferase Ste14
MFMKKVCEGVINFFYNAATGTRRTRAFLTPLFGSVFLCFILLLIVISFFLNRFLKLPEFMAKPFRLAFSLPFLIGGALLWLWCAGIFFKSKGTPVPVNPPPKLVIHGAYAYSRNPMMTGLFMITAGIGIFFGSIALTFIMMPLFVLMSVLEFKYIEEPELMKRFVQAYIEYKNRTPLIIPKIGRKTNPGKL